MKIKFIHNPNLADTLIFETIYAEELQMDLEEKKEISEQGAEFIVMIDEETGNPIGETYFIPVDKFDDGEVDEDQPEQGYEPYYYQNLMYVWSTTILPEYQNQGVGKILKSYLLGYLKGKGYFGVLGHAKEGASIKLNQYFGGKIVNTFDDWYKTGVTHYLYLCEF